MIRLILSICFIFAISLNVKSQLINLGDDWKYNDIGADPADDASGNNWKEVIFDDSAWANGPAELGYGDGDESTVIADPLLASYYRKTINVQNPSAFSKLLLTLKYDDGAVVYINEEEIWRVNMPSGNITYSTLASNNNDATVTKSITNCLVEGNNTIAVEIHNVGIGSSDMSFDFELDVELKTGQELVDFESGWSFYDLGNQPTDQGSVVWNELGYDYGSWETGFGQLGYGDGDENTVISNATITGYFRKEIEVADASIYSKINLDLLYDDGGIVYINGTEVLRINMPAGTINYSTLTSSSDGDNARKEVDIDNVFVDGTNVIAVEIHQISNSSSDLSFDLKVKSKIAKTVTPLSFQSNWNYFDNGVEPAMQTSLKWYDSLYNHVAWSSGLAELGYGDGDEQSVVGAVNAVYFRKQFNISSPSLYDSTLIKLHYDDGAVVYVNGNEVWRQNMGTGNINYSSNAILPKENQLDSIALLISFVQGLNTIAVELHQEQGATDDLSFDLEVVSILKKNTQLIQSGAEWTYFDNATDPPMDGSRSFENYFYATDASWDIGNAHLGYGDGDEATVINNSTYTAYFIHTFDVSDPSLFEEINVNLVFDDGAIVYLNGSELFRRNMPSGAVNYSTFTSGSSGDNAEYSESFTNLLLQGENKIVVEVHQISATSSDISFDLSLDAIISFDQVLITRGPYLQQANDDGVIIKYRTNNATNSIIAYGLDYTSLTDTISILNPIVDHEVSILGLEPETKYYYEIIAEGEIVKAADSLLSFITYPVSGSEKPLRAWILGDCGTGNNNARLVRDAYYNYVGNDHTDMMLFLGDNAYTNGTDEEYQGAIFEDMYEDKLQNTIAWSCLGNHDGHSADSDSQTGPYYDIFTFPKSAESGGVASGTEAYYSFDFGNVHFIILESHETNRSVGGAMYNWCLNDIQNTTAKWIVAMWHHPPYTKGSHDSDVEGQLVSMRENFLPMLESNGVDLVLSGHSHSYERSYYLNGHYGLSGTFDSTIHTVGEKGDNNGKLNGDGAYREAIQGPDQNKGTVYITTGSAGKKSAGDLDHPAMYYSVSDLGSCVLEINQDTLLVKFIRETGSIDDEFAIVKCRGVEVATNVFDSGSGSFRQKVIDACPLDTILFDNSISSQIDLNSEVIIDKDLYIIGNASKNTLTGKNTNRMLHVIEGINLELSNLQFIDGQSSTLGGAFYNQGNIILKDVNFENNYQGAMPKAFTNHGTISTTNYVEVKE